MAKTQVGVKERRNRNDHPQIAIYNRTAKVYANAPYCGSGLYWCFLKSGVDLPLKGPAMVRSWFADSRKIIYRRGQERATREPQTMDVISIFTSHIEGLAPQSTRWDDLDDDDDVYVIGFNTTGGRGTMEGVYLVRREKREIKLVANHITPYLDGTYSSPAPKKVQSSKTVKKVVKR